ncbi:hypothetical protein PR048_021902 [Dryococelus australis]|uniref:Uncharacterized protein n=1 Tax=Dryococelus australis TaxID=614101 RepID=A0ABQ9GZM0_9NEOP|nr:hypothetical protein PR048_021902 [Dryococelus australis]
MLCHSCLLGITAVQSVFKKWAAASCCCTHEPLLFTHPRRAHNASWPPKVNTASTAIISLRYWRAAAAEFALASGLPAVPPPPFAMYVLVVTDRQDSPARAQKECRVKRFGRLFEILIADESGARTGKRETLEKTHRLAASYGTIPTCENQGATSPGIEPMVHIVGGEYSNHYTTRSDCSSTTPPYLGEPGLVPGVIAPGFPHVRIAPDDAVGWRGFLGDIPFLPALAVNSLDCRQLRYLTKELLSHLRQQRVGTPFDNQRLVNYTTAGNAANREFFASCECRGKTAACSANPRRTRQQNGVTDKKHNGTPFSNQRLVTCSPVGNPANGKHFVGNLVARHKDLFYASTQDKTPNLKAPANLRNPASAPHAYAISPSHPGHRIDKCTDTKWRCGSFDVHYGIKEDLAMFLGNLPPRDFYASPQSINSGCWRTVTNKSLTNHIPGIFFWATCQANVQAMEAVVPIVQ